MSQQINLLLPELRPRFDWLGLPVVVSLALAGMLLIAGLSWFGMFQVDRLKMQDAAINAQLSTLQGQVQSLGKALVARQGETGVPAEIAVMRLAVMQRQEVMTAIRQGDIPDGGGYFSRLQGFSRQAETGVWLVGFAFSGNEVEIRGRLTEPALLPVYINRLNAEPAFVGRRFATLDMKGMDPAAELPASGTVAPKLPATPRYTEFSLRTEPRPVAEVH